MIPMSFVHWSNPLIILSFVFGILEYLYIRPLIKEITRKIELANDEKEFQLQERYSSRYTEDE